MTVEEVIADMILTRAALEQKLIQSEMISGLRDSFVERVNGWIFDLRSAQQKAVKTVEN